MKTKNNHGLSAKQVAYARRVFSDPVLFASHILGAELWEGEVEILRAIQHKRRIAIKACHGVGKTFTLAVATLWWLARFPEGIVLTTSATQRQVKTQLWFEIHRAAEGAKVPYPPLKTTELKFRDDNNFAIGFSTNQTENFQGYHGKNVLIIADEAPGIESGIWDAIAGTMAGGNVHIVMAGNPTVPSGAFFDAFAKERGLWNTITVDAFDSPNLKGMKLEELLLLDPTEGGPLDQNPIPYLVTKRWVYDQYLAWWHGSESSSPQWMSRVRAQFPDQSQNSLIKLRWLERARQRAQDTNHADAGLSPLVAGVDVGGGEAETVVYVCDCRYEQTTIIDMRAWRGEDTRGQVVEFLNAYRRQLSVVRVDSIGIGFNFAKHLRDCRFVVDEINVGIACESKPELGANDPAQRFVNLKASYYQNVADTLERDQLYGLTDETTIGQLANIQYEIDSHGRVKIESKEDARKRGASSFDRAEALMLALCKPYQKFEYLTVRDLARLRAEADLDFDEDDCRPRTRRGFWESWAPGSLASYFRRHPGAC
jgi:phage terminase large subunit